jgi:hypothetical protein
MFVYGSENWAQNRSERRKIETAKILFLKVSLWMYTYRPCTQYDSTQFIANICFKKSKTESKWHNHILRMDLQG